MEPTGGTPGDEPPLGKAAGRSTYDVLAATSRALVLEKVRSQPGVDTASLSRLTGLHPNTVRFHLDVLAQAGAVTASRDPARKPGRPRLLFTAARIPPASPQDPVGGLEPASQDGYAMLAAVLIRHLQRISNDPAAAAEAAGRMWVIDRAGQDRTDSVSSDVDIAVAVTTLFGELGFAPETMRDHDGWRILLHRCPFHSLAAEHPEIVCRLHLGLLQGAVDQLGGLNRAARLQPFVAPGLCEALIPLTELHR